MSPILDRKLRFSDVAFGIDATPKTLRNWLQRDQVTLTSSGEGGWRDFSIIDVALLAIVRKLVTFGVPLDDADGIASAVVMRQVKVLASYRSVAIDALLACFHYRRIFVLYDGAWRFIEVDGPGPVDFGTIDACIHIDLHRVIDRAVKRAVLGSDIDEGPFTDETMQAGLRKLIITIQDATPSSAAAGKEAGSPEEEG